ncbi:FAD-binding protein [bacterium]|nr:FAD-binding protein [bacterium]
MEKEITLDAFKYEGSKDDLISLVAEEFPSISEEINDVVIERKSLDARSKQIKVHLRLSIYTGESTAVPLKMPEFKPLRSEDPVHVVGFGPAGIFAAFKLLQEGYQPIILERGKAVRERRRDVAKLNRDGILNSESNYCFGEGGAGTFSDGKLYTRSHKRGKIREILELFVLHGADPAILYEAHPHIGTNKLPGIIEQMRNTLIRKGAIVRFNAKLTGIQFEGNQIKTISVNGKREACEELILATGHSARDVYEMLFNSNIKIEAKPFAMGFRIEHPQELINQIQYHKHKNREVLPSASYSLVEQVEGKGVFSFCMCPGGIIAPAATSQGELVVNGWSPSKRNGPYANSGWVTEIGEDEWKEFHDAGPLAGLKFQQQIENKAFKLAGGSLKVPAQNLKDYLANRTSENLNENSYHPGVVAVNLNELYPEEINSRLRKGLEASCKKLKGFNSEKAIVTAPESRTSAPVRIPRTEHLHHPELLNLYPCGEGAGYAGGIVSAALDGVRVAKALAQKHI